MSQMQPNSPRYFDDSLRTRAAPLRYRQVGSPYAFLNSIGIDAILERMYKAANLIDVAEEIGISVTILLHWLEAENHMQRVEEAAKFSAEGFLSEAVRLLRNASNDFELKKADKIANHGRFMASKLDKAKYGADNKQVGNAAGVTFIMHMGGNTPITAQLRTAIETNTPPKELSFLEGEYTNLAGFVTPTPDGVCEPSNLGPFEDEPFDVSVATMPGYLKDE